MNVHITDPCNTVYVRCTYVDVHMKHGRVPLVPWSTVTTVLYSGSIAPSP